MFYKGRVCLVMSSHTLHPPTIYQPKEALTLPPEFCDSKGARHLFSIPRPTLYQWAAEGKIKAVSLRREGSLRGKKLWVVSSIREYLMAHIEPTKDHGKPAAADTSEKLARKTLLQLQKCQSE